MIKIEEPAGGRRGARWGPPFFGPGEDSAYFLSINRNKKSVAVDLKTPEGREVFLRSCRVADVAGRTSARA